MLRFDLIHYSMLVFIWIPFVPMEFLSTFPDFKTAIPMFFREKIAFWEQYIPKLLPSGNDHFDCGIPQVTLASPFYDYVSS